MKNELLKTKGKFLVEASASDKKWGNGLHIRDKRRMSLWNWKGQNLLGKLLTEIRDAYLKN